MIGNNNYIDRRIMNKNEKCCNCCRVEAVISVDERGQTVLPKELRDKADIKAGDKLAVVTLQKDKKISCLAIIKADQISLMVKDLLGPLAGELTKK
jgi:AbrB family looped-hinge helix DNA binding protein